MGLIAHDFSGNKLQFLDSARESFNLALKWLPLPYVSTEGGTYAQREDSPIAPEFRSPALSVNRTPPASRKWMSAAGWVTETPPSVSSSSVYSTESAISNGRFVQECSASSPQKRTYQTNRAPHAHINSQEGTSECNPSEHPATPAPGESRLDRSASSRQALQDDLVPSPLFSRNPKCACPPRPDSNDNTRPLPPLPFNHKSDFKAQGTRIIQDPLMRKTAVQTLIARFEGVLPLSPSSPLATAQPPLREQVYGLEASTPSPGVTSPRFRMIRDAVSPDPHNEQLEAYLTSCASTALTRYNTHLADFCGQLRKHIAYVDGEIGRVQKIQGERSAARALGPKHRLASFWSIEVAPPSKSKPTSGSTCAGRSTNLVGNDRGHDHGSPVEDPQDKVKKEKIDKLRRQGWKVCKERHGFKGVEFYEDLRRRVEAELAGRF
ncbi:uncharacterized protein A1O5_02651 [Cladophialophora psammophila CBS 110553]|uniref:Uncharacterized protein n=1 Tax=Cladophialophora psammophila CBS 110553 TaxID=1182543 RepID=W9XAL4_9EURO|nr:uncharacterized protein A1O5_02651 [Cladophialophora psammophila CBS 110553]EXJ74355.1 hypothetical protein A1O5_02651 [Cladophialophora psammophila CBS 110553]